MRLIWVQLLQVIAKKNRRTIQIGINEGGKAILDGRNTKIKGFESGTYKSNHN